MVHKLHEIIRPFMLRRLKRDVLKEIPAKIEICLYCGMSALQKKWYKNVLSRNIDEINRRTKSKTRLLNILMQLGKCVIIRICLKAQKKDRPLSKESIYILIAVNWHFWINYYTNYLHRNLEYYYSVK
eukprot:TRINITY_DN8781_c0_g1_i1.p1 TRINITY_DN8781_c0_g1~~TRINITY_DN8781_c0_g1_i1.p1  ORF type:complete len:149 (-),score=38.75 TRINITY_DN8781_c0_g1_i1:85-468(-)